MNESADPDSFAMSRRTRRPFPPYRYVPGRNPHPIAHPQGHSYRPAGTPEPQVPFVTPERWFESEDYGYGCDLYNHAYWWEAHEAWEGLWHLPEKASPQKEFLQALIQVSACHLNLWLIRLDGVHRLLQTSSAHFDRAGIQAETYMGLPVLAFRRSVNDYYERILAQQSPRHDPKWYPYLRLQY